MPRKRSDGMPTEQRIGDTVDRTTSVDNGSSNGKRTKRPSNVVYLLIGESASPPYRTIIGEQPTRGKCWRQWEAIKYLASANYVNVSVVKGKLLSPDDLYRNITRQRKPRE